MITVSNYTFQISPQDCDFREQVSLFSLGDLILQVAGKAADANGFGTQLLNSLNLTWVLSRLSIDMQRFPVWREQITIETWVEEVGRASTTRHFRVTDNEGTVIGGASSIWAMIDISTRRPVDLQTVKGLNDAATGIPPIVEKPGRLPSVEENRIKEHRVVYSDIDFNRHTNSMKYVEWLLDCFSLKWHQSHIVKRLEVNFLHEVLFDETVVIFKKQEGDLSLFEIKKTDGGSICKVRIDSLLVS
jgi:medium-chain acyl-[acyl-carrier-protein] hydrolase